METQRPKVNDIVKIYCCSSDMSYYYGRVTEIKSLGIVVDTGSDIGKAYFSFAANCIIVVGREEATTDMGWAYIGNLVEAERP